MSTYRYAQIDGESVCVVISEFRAEVDADNLIPIGSDESPIGHTWLDGEWIAPPPQPDPFPHTITRRQIMTGLAMAEWITEQEALDAMTTGARPAAVDMVINALPEQERFHAQMKWAGFQQAYRDDPLVLALAAAEGKTPQEVDDFFIMCAGIE